MLSKGDVSVVKKVTSVEKVVADVRDRTVMVEK